MDKHPRYGDTAEQVFSSRAFSLRRDSLSWPDRQTEETAYILEYPDWVSATAITRHGELLLVRQYRHGVRDWVLELPGGWIKPDDIDREHAIRRELLEETGHVFEQIEPLMSLSPNPGTHNNRLHTFLAIGGESLRAPRPEDDEHLEVLTIPLHEVEARLLDGALLDNGHLSCLFLGLMRLGRLQFSHDEGAAP